MTDKYVSRGHFMLRAHAGGVLLVNGVPHCRGGGLRPPVNGTRLLAPAHRPMTPNEEYLIERGTEIVLALPNGSQVQIDAQVEVEDGGRRAIKNKAVFPCWSSARFSLGSAAPSSGWPSCVCSSRLRMRPA